MDRDKTGKISARVISHYDGVKFLENIVGVRIKSKDYVLLIMEDYLPTLGKIDGDVFFITTDDELPYKNINGFYKHQSNEFTLLIESINVDKKLENENDN